MSRLKGQRETYRGSKARRYEATRKGAFWDAEQAAMTHVLDRFAAGTRILDCPVGTGRFLPLYEERGFDVTGVDLSADMMAEAAKKRTSAELAQGSVFALDFLDAAFDVAVCVRLLNWLETYELTHALASLARSAPLVFAGAGTKNGNVARRSVQCIHEEREWLAHVEAAGLTVVGRHVVQKNDRGDFHLWELAR
jgi:SAM-dependent methyltransferase